MTKRYVQRDIVGNGHAGSTNGPQRRRRTQVLSIPLQCALRSAGRRPATSTRRAGHRGDAFLRLQHRQRPRRAPSTSTPTHLCIFCVADDHGIARLYTFLQLYSSKRPRDTPTSAGPRVKKKHPSSSPLSTSPKPTSTDHTKRPRQHVGGHKKTRLHCWMVCQPSLAPASRSQRTR